MIFSPICHAHLLDLDSDSEKIEHVLLGVRANTDQKFTEVSFLTLIWHMYPAIAKSSNILLLDALAQLGDSQSLANVRSRVGLIIRGTSKGLGTLPVLVPLISSLGVSPQLFIIGYIIATSFSGEEGYDDLANLFTRGRK